MPVGVWLMIRLRDSAAHLALGMQLLDLSHTRVRVLTLSCALDSIHLDEPTLARMDGDAADGVFAEADRRGMIVEVPDYLCRPYGADASSTS